MMVNLWVYFIFTTVYKQGLSSFVKPSTVKFFFIGSAVSLTLLMFMWPAKQESRLSLSPTMEAGESSSNVDSLTETNVKGMTSTIMEAPHFSGEDEKGRRWNIQATEAVQRRFDTSETMVLNGIDGFSILENGDKFTFEANSGSYENETGNVYLNGAVRLMGRGYTLKTGEIYSNLTSMAVYSNQNVFITSDQGVLEAGRFNVHPGAEKIEFAGGVKVRFVPRKGEE